MANIDGFLRVFNGFSARHNRHSLFADFVFFSASALHNGVRFSQELEDQYLVRAKKYEKEEMGRFASLLTELIGGLEVGFNDFLGEVYMGLEISNKRAGQYFTPYCISKLMSTMTQPGEHSFNSLGFISMCEPACGSGTAVIAYADAMKKGGYNPQQSLFVQAWDIDETAALMCFIQLALFHIPAEVVVGNTLTLEHSRVIRTPAYHLSGWEQKLALHDALTMEKEPAPKPQPDEPRALSGAMTLAPEFQEEFNF